MRVLLVEDSARVAEAVGASMRASGHAVFAVSCVHAAEDAVERAIFDLAVVDVGLPDGSGLDWCRATRRAGNDMPILVLSARNTLADRVTGLDAGADDYLGKPFRLEELLARVRALGRRGPRWTESVRAYGRVVVDADRRRVSVDDDPLPLTARELEIVMLVSSRSGRVVPQGELLESVWGDAGDRARASLDVLLARIRRKLAERGVRDALRTVRQTGYQWALERSKPG